MTKSAQVFLGAVALLCCRLCAASWAEERAVFAESQQQAARKIADLLTEVEPIELVSLDPFPPSRRPEDPGDHVGRNRVRMRALLRQKDRLAPVVRALEASLTESVIRMFPEASLQVFPPGCFLPQHGFRLLKDGKEVYILICYLCSTGYISGLSENPIEFHTTRSSREIVEQLFIDSGLPPAEKEYPRRANQSLEPTTLLGTSAAEQPLVPSRVVAHL